MKIKAPKPQPTPPPPTPAPLPTEDDATVAARKALAMREMRTRRGRRATLLHTGALGDQGGASGYKPLLS